MNKELNAAEAVYGFVGWLTTREERTVMSAKDDCAPIAELIKRFCTENNLPEVSDQWPLNLIHPSGEVAVPNKINDAPYKVDPPVSRELYEENMRNRTAFKSQPLAVMLDKSDVTNWSATDVKLLLDTVRITAPYTPDQLKKIQIFIGLLVEIKEPS